VAAYPVAGPLDVVGSSRGGVLDADLRTAALAALEVPWQCARARALQFDWQTVVDQFVAYLVEARPPRRVTEPSQKVHKLAP
jgi:hypothetical protein